MMAALLGLAGLWLLLAAVWLAVYPLLAGGAASHSSAAGERRDLEVEKARLVAEIHELELDYATGKLSEDDFKDMEAELKTQAVAVLEELESGASGDRSSG
ncbi:MAG: hypothetical protein ABR559_05480 [Gemmatimonadota bacterium]